MKPKLHLAAAISSLMFSGLFLTPAFAMDIPVLTWEQGKSQSVVLGDPTGINTWDVTLKSDAGVTKRFKASRSNSAGFKVYTINIPVNLQVGNYTVQTAAPNYPATVVANVLVIPQSVYEIPRAPIDLLLIFGLLSILVSAPSLLRSANLRFVRIDRRLTDIANIIEGRYWNLADLATLNSLEIKRVNSYKLLRPSVLKQLLLIDGSHVYKYKFHFFAVLPILSLFFAAGLFIIQVLSNEFINSTTLVVIALLIAISFIDLYAGLVAGMLYTTLNVVFYSQFGIRGLTQAVLIAIAFVLPAAINLFGIAFINEVNEEFKKSWLYSFIGASSGALGIITVISLESGDFNLLAFVASLSLGLYLIARKKYQVSASFLRQNVSADKEELMDNSSVVRVVSPLTIVSFSIVLMMVFFNWSESLPISIFATIFWTLPLLITILKFENKLLKYLKNLPRNLYIELLAVVLCLLGISYLSQILPLLIQDRVLLLMSLLAFPSIIHAVYVALAESGRQLDKK